MPRDYRPDPHSKPYVKRSATEFEAAFQAIKKGKSIRQASRDYKIPYTVLQRHFKNRDLKKQGGQTALSAEEEDVIVSRILLCAEWGYPFDRTTLRKFIKGYLDRQGKIIKIFKNNMPGHEFTVSFLKRHKDQLSLRMCQNIKRARAAVSRSVIKDYFDNLKKELDGVVDTNIVNFDETNLADEPGRYKIIAKRGSKYPERVMNSSKSATSIMFAAAADGHLLPTYVVYRAKHLYNTWMENAPKGTRFNRSSSGWFDSECFDDWLATIVVPYFSKLSGIKVLIGDNLSAHLSVESVRLCKKNGIRMVFLPSNSTHLTQPLDVSFFRPLKQSWRKILTNWKLGPGRKECSVPKHMFPRLLSQLLRDIAPNSVENVKAGFKKCGILPFDPLKVMDRLPSDEIADHREITANNIDHSLIQLLSELRGTNEAPVMKRKSKIAVEPGKSVPALTIDEADKTDEEADETDEEEADEDISEAESIEMSDVMSASNSADKFTPFIIKPNDYIIAKFKTNKHERRFLAQVESVSETAINVKCLRKKVGKKDVYFVFPDVDDCCEISQLQVERRVNPYKIYRGQHRFNIDAKYLE